MSLGNQRENSNHGGQIGRGKEEKERHVPDQTYQLQVLRILVHFLKVDKTCKR